MSKTVIYASCRRDGVIVFSKEREDPDVIAFVRGPEDDLRKTVSVGARHAYEGDLLLVPGIPEAGEDGDAALDALCEWVEWMEGCHPELEWRPE